MATRLFNQAMARQNFDRPPVWFMRQAGRYHQHYQKIRQEYSFVDVCKKPEVAAEATMGPIDDFGFDAAILFSDILFPLEVLGMPLDYNPGPDLGFLLRSAADVERLSSPNNAEALRFQLDAIERIRARLPNEKGLIGFVGAPLTLYYFAVEGSHKQALDSARAGLRDGRYEQFCERMLPLLTQNMMLQAQGPIDAMAMFDTCAGDLSPEDYQTFAVPAIAKVLKEVRAAHPTTKIIYYSKGTGPKHWNSLLDLPIDCLGVDWTHNLADVLVQYGDRFAIQGNFDQTMLRDLSQAKLDEALRQYFAPISKLESKHRRGWVCGLGHGVLPNTPEENVTLFLEIQKEIFG